MGLRSLVVLGIVGLIAQLVDGSLGMAYGLTSTTLLLTVGIAPAVASAAVHLSEVGTTLASGISHWKFGNVDWGKVGWMAVPGGVGAFLGAVVLSSISAEAAQPVVAIFLFCLGAYILIRFSFKVSNLITEKPISRKFLSPLGLVAGFLDAAGGGGWGPISTPTLLSSGRMQPRKVLGTAVAGVILLTNARTFLKAIGVDPGVNYFVYAGIVAIWLVARYFAPSFARRDSRPLIGSEASA